MATIFYSGEHQELPKAQHTGSFFGLESTQDPTSHFLF